MAKVLVVCARRFNAHELFVLLGVLQQKGHTFEVTSTDTIIKDEITLQRNRIQQTVYETSPEEAATAFDAISIVSGNMEDTEAYWTDNHVLATVQSFRDRDKVVSAICCSVPTLAPVCRGTKVSYFPLVRSKHRLELFGAILNNVSLTVDRHIITAENQMLSQMWAEEICNALDNNQTPLYHFTESGFVPKGRERRMHPSVRSAIDEARLIKKDRTP